MTNHPPFLITHWCGIPAPFMRRSDGSLAIERIEELREAGMTLIAIDDCGVQTNREILHCCHELGLSAMVCDPRATAAVFDEKNREALLRALVNDYRDCPALYSYYVLDEPNSRDFPALGEVLRILRRLDPEREGYINLFPNYASAAQLGNDSYRAHLAQYLDTVKPAFLSYDHYHFMQEKATTDLVLDDARQNAILHDAYRQIDRPGFFDNLEQVRAADAHGIPFMLIVLLTEHGPYRNLSEGEIRFEVFQALAYGSARISYFTYWTPSDDDHIWHWQNGMIAKDGSRTQHYYDVQKINRELQTLGSALAGNRPISVCHIGSEPDRLITPWQGGQGSIADIQAERLTVSTFDNGAILLASKNHAAAQTVTLTLRDGKTVCRCNPHNGAWEPLLSTDARITLTLAPGDAALLR